MLFTDVTLKGLGASDLVVSLSRETKGNQDRLPNSTAIGRIQVDIATISASFSWGII